MTLDVWVNDADDAFIDDIDEVIEETMIQIFVLHPKDEDQLEQAKAYALEHNSIFYCVPARLKDEIDTNCVALCVENLDELASIQELQKPLFLNASDLDKAMIEALVQSDSSGIILNAVQSYERLEKFYISLGPDNIDTFEKSMLEKLPMDKMVLHSGYPKNGFDEIFETSKKISDLIFRPDPSIIAAATNNSLILFGFKKG